ncbi:MAG: hypothetical protein HQM09_15860 [Candidatus Riflebacteria bacterium]|nr:hypothetical protein [Candidatus Riflebacteria bacterium]
MNQTNDVPTLKKDVNEECHVNGNNGEKNNDGNGNNGEEGFTEWLLENNPLYLVSVLLMFLGLHLVSRDASGENGSIWTIVAFFGVQNVYELFMIGMSLYLLTAKINARHGKILLILVLLFLTDLTFYQVRISAMSAVVGAWASGIYLFLAGIKIAAAVKVLAIRVRWERLIYPLMAFAVIYFSPQYLYHVVDGIGLKQAGGPTPVIPFSGVHEVYMIWLVAAFIHIPVIVGAWRKNDLEGTIENQYLGDENGFYRWLLLFPFIVLPVQLMVNVMNDVTASNAAIGFLGFNLVPYLLVAVFFIQLFIRSFIDQVWSLNSYDFIALTVVFCYALGSETSNNAFAFPYAFNRFLIILAHIAVMVTRSNLGSAWFLMTVAAWYSFSGITHVAGKAVTYGQSLSKTAWAVILMIGSFVFLGLGFLVSLKSHQKKSLSKDVLETPQE